MATKANPFYKFRTPGFEQGFAGLSEIFAGGGTDVKPSQIAQNEAQARAADALASERAAKMQGQLDTNAAMMANPRFLAELIANGGRATDDPLQLNPNYQAPGPTDFSLTAKPTAGEISSVFAPTVTAQDRIGGALQELFIRGGKADELFKVLGQAGYDQNVRAGTPDAGMGYLPLFGAMPTDKTALSTTRQDAMSARDAAEDLAKTRAAEGIRANSRSNVARIQQEGALERTNATNVTREIIATGKPNAPNKIGAGGRAPVVPRVSPNDAKAITGVLEAELKAQGITVDSGVLTGLVSAAGGRMQDPTRTDSFKNVAGAVDSILVDLENNELDGFKRKVTKKTFMGVPMGEGATLERQPKPAPKAPPIDKVQGAPRGSTIGNFDVGKGWQVKDSAGKLIGYVQE